mgnify:CR=1 FL=1
MIDDMEIEIYALKQEQLELLMELYNSIDTLSSFDEVVIQIVDEEVPMFLHGDKTAEQVAEIIQNRVNLYVTRQGTFLLSLFRFLETKRNTKMEYVLYGAENQLCKALHN